METGQGVTFIYGNRDPSGDSPFTALHERLVSAMPEERVKEREDQSSAASKSDVPPHGGSARGDGQADDRNAVAPMKPGDARERDQEADVYSGRLTDLWQFVLRDGDRTYHLATDMHNTGQTDFFSLMIAGHESAWLGHQIDYQILSDRHAQDAAKRESFQRLRERVNRARLDLSDGESAEGKLVRAKAEFKACKAELSVLNQDALSIPQLTAILEADERQVAALKSEEADLAREQRLMVLLERKSEYESLLDLRRQLKEIEEREGRYGSRITDLGHDITVHELTDLAQWRNNAAELNRNITKLENVSEEQKKRKNNLEQNRILLAHRMRKNRELKDALTEEYEYWASKSDEERRSLSEFGAAGEENARIRSFPTAVHLILLASFLLLAIGLITISVVKAVGILLIALAALGVLSSFYLHFTGGRRPRVLERRKGAPSSADDADVRSQINDFDSQMMADQKEWDRLSDAIAELEREMAQLSIQIESSKRHLKNLQGDLLGTIRKYAGPTEIHEIDDIIETLSKQRESSASHNEAVADLLRRIADLKHGRSDEDMVREYESVCEQLYGGRGFNVIDDVRGNGEHAATHQLRFDPGRAKQISGERVEISRVIDEKTAEMKNTKAKLARSKEASIAAESMLRKCEMLAGSIKEMENDLSRHMVSIAWLDQVLALWDEIDVMRWMEAAVIIVNRISGRRAGGESLPVLPAEAVKHSIRSPELSVKSFTPYAPPAAIDDSVFRQTPAEQNYLALRLALACQHLSRIPERGPLFLMDPVIPLERSQIEELVNALEEWTLETGRQIIFFTTEHAVHEVVKDRQMVVYRVE